MADAHVAKQAPHMTRAEHIPHQPIVFAQEQTPVLASCHTRGILAAVLQYSETIKQALIDWTTCHDADYAAHTGPLYKEQN
jgi:hypothetical protein